jgi:hypothetical protein
VASYYYIDYLEDIKYLALEYNRTAITTPIFNANNDLEGPLIEPAFVTASDATFMDDIRTRQSIKGIVLILFNSIFD